MALGSQRGGGMVDTKVGSMPDVLADVDGMPVAGIQAPVSLFARLGPSGRYAGVPYHFLSC